MNSTKTYHRHGKQDTRLILKSCCRSLNGGLQRLIISGSQANDLANALKYALCNYPPALFEAKDILLNAVKSQLAAVIWCEVPLEPPPSQNFKYVLDMGALLHSISWQLGATYGKILQDFGNHVTEHYRQAVVVFDGYEAGPSTKYSTHQRRKGCEGRKVTFNLSMKFQLKKDDFLFNKENKQRFIDLLEEHLAMCGCVIAHATGDADVPNIIQAAVTVPYTCEAVLVGDYPDLLVLLIHLADRNKHTISFRPESKKGGALMCIGVSSIRNKLGEYICGNILFVHAFLGCDTTSRLVGIGKAAVLNIVKEKETFREQAEVFRSVNSSKDQVIAAGEKVVTIVQKGRLNDHLDTMRYQRFQELVTTRKKSIHPNMLPPTSAATKYHSLRVFHQVQQWQGNTLPAEDWRWELSEGRLKPDNADFGPAPQSLLDIVRCTCMTGCGPLRCGCRRQGMPCSSACSRCRGICQNMSNNDVHDNEDSEM